MEGRGAFEGIRAVLFDLGGTLWSPFGDRTWDEVFEAASGVLLEGLPGGAPGADARRFIAELRDCVGLRTVSASQEEFVLRGLARLRDRLRNRELPLPGPSSACLSAGGRGEGPGTFESFERFREMELLSVTAGLLRRAGVRDERWIAEASLEFARRLSAECSVYEDTVSALRAIRSGGLVLGIVSNTSVPPRVMDDYLERAGLCGAVDFRVYSSEVGWRKPHPAIYAAASEAAGVPAGACLFVGDRFLEDVAGPQAFGMKAVLCCRSGKIPAEAAEGREGFRPDLVISDLRELVSRLSS